MALSAGDKQQISIGLGGLAIVGAAWFFLFRGKTFGGGSDDQAGQRPVGIITEDKAVGFASIWAREAMRDRGTPVRTGVAFHEGKAPGQSQASWELVQASEGGNVNAFYYVEYRYPNGDFLTIMINAFTGEKPRASAGWVAGRMDRNFGLLGGSEGVMSVRRSDNQGLAVGSSRNRLSAIAPAVNVQPGNEVRVMQ